jgi:TetR/AcrR family tetracycline transcriptional repressor
MAMQKDVVIAKALELLDETGLDGLTMRRLADALDIKAASLYWHFASKQVLLDGIADALMRDVALAPVAGDWRTRLKDVAGQFRRALLARRDGARVYAGTYVVSDNVMRVGEALMAPLHEAGADAKLASWGAFSLLYYMLGFVIEETGLAADTLAAEDVQARSAQFTAQAQRFPLLSGAHAHVFDSDFDARFEFGLDLLLAGLAERLPR